MERQPPRWFDVRTAAQYAGVSVDSIYKACSRKELRHTRIGGRRVLKFLPEWLDEWIAATVVEPQQEPLKGDANGSLQTV
jgi:excisionase family DNA binding protein